MHASKQFLIISIFVLVANIAFAGGPGDANNDGVVDLSDLIMIGVDYGKDSDFRAGADLDKDGMIGLGDLVVVGLNYGKVWCDFDDTCNNGEVEAYCSDCGAVGCVCTGWQQGACGGVCGDGYRQQTRSCPDDCDEQSQCVPDVACQSGEPGEVLAFPGAQGFGAKASGGRGGQVIKVINLNAEGPGSLQWALNQQGPRIIVFAVSGVIEKDIVEIPYGDVTIAGQTAPGAGITIKGRLFADYSSGPDNIIVRHIRVRPEYDGTDGSQFDTIQFSRDSNFILDHVSASFGVDETVDLYSATDATVQWSIISQSGSLGHPEGSHNYGLINGPDGQRVSVHHNLFVHHKNRNPAIANGPSEVINNVVYNVRHGFVHHNPAKGRIRIIGNYYRQGPEDSLIPFFLDAEDVGANLGYHFYQNYIDDPGDYIGMVDNPLGSNLHSTFSSICSYHAGGSCAQYVSGTDFDFSSFNDRVEIMIDDPKTAYTDVLSSAGAFPRDTVDITNVQETRDRTGSWGARIPSNLMAGLSPSSPPTDADDDGIADSWETSHGLDTSDSNDHNTVMPSGYTAIEEYVNELGDALVG